VASPGLPTAAVEGSEVEPPSSAAEVAPEAGAGPVACYLAGGAAACVHLHQPSSLAEHPAVDQCGLEQLPLSLGLVVAFPGVQPSLRSLSVPCPFADFDPVGGEGERVSSPRLLLVSEEPSSFEHQPPVESSKQFLLLLVAGQWAAAVAADLVADWEVVGPLRFQP